MPNRLVGSVMPVSLEHELKTECPMFVIVGESAALVKLLQDMNVWSKFDTLPAMLTLVKLVH